MILNAHCKVSVKVAHHESKYTPYIAEEGAELLEPLEKWKRQRMMGYDEQFCEEDFPI